MPRILRRMVPDVVAPALILLHLISLVACTGSDSTHFPHPNPSASPNPPRSIISLVPNATEILFRLGLGSRIRAVSAFSNYPPEARQLPPLADFQGIQIEKVVGMRPDLIIGMPTSGNRSSLQRLQDLGYPVLFIEIKGVKDIFRAIEDISKSCGAQKRGAELILSLKQEISRVRERLRSVDRVPVLFVVGRKPLIVAGRGSYIGELIEFAGGKNIASDSLVPYPPFSMEEVIARAPEVIIDTGFSGEPGPEEIARAVASWGQYPSIPAVESGRILCTKDTSLFIPGPRIVEGLHKMADMLHPNALARGVR